MAAAPSSTFASWSRASPGRSEAPIKRRHFLECGALVTGAAALGTFSAAWGAAEPRRYSRALLVDARGDPLKASTLTPRTNYVFHYPFASTPCFLLNLGKPVTAPEIGRAHV